MPGASGGSPDHLGYARLVRLILVQTGNTLPAIASEKGDFDAMFLRGLFGDGQPAERVIHVDPREGDALPDPTEADAVLVTGSASMVTERLDWSERTKRWLPKVLDARVPLLAVCYGHQLLAEAAGGRVGRNPNGREIGTIEVTLTDAGQADPLLGSLQEPLLSMQSTHVESVLELPPGATLLGHTSLDPHQTFRVGERAWGVQFHPEIDADVSRWYVEGRAEIIRGEGLDPDALAAAVRETPSGTRLLRRFAQLVREGS